MLENRTPVLFVTPRKQDDGTAKMEVHKGKNVEPDKFDRVGGRLTNIEYKESTDAKGVVYKKWQICLEDDGEFILQVGYASGYTRGLMNALANIDFSQPVKIGCYVSNDFLCLSVMQKEVGLIKWKYETMPKTKKVVVGSQEVVDDSEAVEWTKNIVKEILSKIAEQKSRTVQAVPSITSNVDMVEVDSETIPDREIDDLPF